MQSVCYSVGIIVTALNQIQHRGKLQAVQETAGMHGIEFPEAGNRSTTGDGMILHLIITNVSKPAGDVKKKKKPELR